MKFTFPHTHTHKTLPVNTLNRSNTNFRRQCSIFTKHQLEYVERQKRNKKELAKKKSGKKVRVYLHFIGLNDFYFHFRTTLFLQLDCWTPTQPIKCLQLALFSYLERRICIQYDDNVSFMFQLFAVIQSETNGVPQNSGNTQFHHSIAWFFLLFLSVSMNLLRLQNKILIKGIVNWMKKFGKKELS